MHLGRRRQHPVRDRRAPRRTRPRFTLREHLTPRQAAARRQVCTPLRARLWRAGTDRASFPSRNTPCAGCHTSGGEVLTARTESGPRAPRSAAISWVVSYPEAAKAQPRAEPQRVCDTSYEPVRGRPGTLVEVVRGGFVRKRAPAAGCSDNEPGRRPEHCSVGAASAPMYPRSAEHKPLQARSACCGPGSDLWQPRLLALVCAHRAPGESFHIDGVRRILAMSGLDESLLRSAVRTGRWAILAVEKAIRTGTAEVADPRSGCSGLKRLAGMLRTTALNGGSIRTCRRIRGAIRHQLAISCPRRSMMIHAGEQAAKSGGGRLRRLRAAVRDLAAYGLAPRLQAGWRPRSEGAEARVAAAIRDHPELRLRRRAAGDSEPAPGRDRD